MYEKITLKNGVRIVYEHMSQVRTASVGIWIGVGSRYEKRRQNGSAHFIEHMLFKGTEKRTASELAEEMDIIGGQINAFTTREATCFYARVLDTRLESAIDILSDMFFHSKLAAEDVENERGVIFEEIDMYDDAPDDMVSERMMNRCFPGSLGRPVLGTGRSLKGLDAEVIRAFKAENYIAPRIVVALSGSFTAEHLRHIQNLFSPMEKVRGKTPKATAYVPCFTLKRKSTEQNHLCLGFPGLRAGDDARFAMQIMSIILGGGMSSRLFQTVREKNGLCYSIYSFNATFRETGLFGVATALGQETEGRAISLILDELDKLRQEGITHKELERAREQSKASVLMSLESTSSRMNRIGFGELSLGSVPSVDEVISRYDAVTLDDVLALAGRVIVPERMSFSAVGRTRQETQYRTELKM